MEMWRCEKSKSHFSILVDIIGVARRRRTKTSAALKELKKLEAYSSSEHSRLEPIPLVPLSSALNWERESDDLVMAAWQTALRVLCVVGVLSTAVAFSPAGFVPRRLALSSSSLIPPGQVSIATTKPPRRHLTSRRASALNELFEPGPGESLNGPRFVFVGGKGGVGKTSTSAALAVRLADAGLRVLVVSTDPAHSLGDALALGDTLRESAGAPVPVEGPGEATGGSLDALEVDSKAAMANLGQALAAFDITEAARDVGGQAAADFVDKLGLKDFAKLLETPPPGIDEIVALSDVLKFARGSESGGVAYDRVLIDTAPTGHTLRLLSAPDFLDALLRKVTGLRARLGGALGMGASLFGLDVAALNAKLDKASNTLEDYREGVAELRALFRSDTQTQFIAVASPTPLAVAETRRLVAALAEQEVAVNHLVVNKVLAGGVSAGSVAAGADVDESVGSSGAAAAAAADAAVMATMRRGQAAALERATSPGSPLASVPQLTVTQVPLFDADISGVSGLRYMAAVAFAGKYEVADLRATTPLGNPSDDAAASMAVATRAGEVTARQDAWAKLTAPADDPRSSSYSSSGGDDGDREGVDQRFVVVGGKGGVGKTSTSAALAVACCETGGYNTVVVSTDPAHSLGDALGIELPRGALMPVTDVDSSGTYGGTPGGCLYALEVDTAGAVAEFKALVQSFAATAAADQKAGGSGSLLGGLNLGDFADVLDTAPPGLDELVALTKVLQLVQQRGGVNVDGENADSGSGSGSSGSDGSSGAETSLGGAGVRFDRIIIDTAPTGHTLRLLSLPQFLDDFLEKLIALRKKVQGASNFLGNLKGLGGLGGLGSSSGGGSSVDADAAAATRDRLREFQVRMYALEDLLTDPAISEFVVVTVPTELAVAESERLVLALAEEDIAVNHLVLNQVLRPAPPEGASTPAGPTYVDRLRAGQSTCIAELLDVAAQAKSSSSSSKSGGGGAPVAVTQVPWLDTEARGVYGLRALGQALLR